MRALVLALLLLVLAPAVAGAQATRTWVSGVGDDVNPCSRTAPCKTLAGAIAKTAAGGEVNAIDSGGFGAVTITKAITIDLSGVHGSVLHSGTNGIVVNAGEGDDVLLREVSVNGAGPGGACPGITGLAGLKVVKARSVLVQDSDFSRQTTGIDVVPSAGAPSVLVDGTSVSDTCETALRVAPAAPATAEVLVQDATFARASTGVDVADRGRVLLQRTSLFDHELALRATGTGELIDGGGLTLFGNTSDGAPTRSTAVRPADGAAGADGAPGPAGPPGPPGPAGPAGADGRALAPPLRVALKGPLTVRRGRAARLGFVLTAPATVTLEVRRGRRLLARTSTAAAPGAGTLRWSARRRGRPVAPGRYTVRVVARAARGSAADADSATLRVR